jgi:tRNA acetyltransferase TAN1
MVHAICTDASDGSRKKSSRFIKRLVPMTLMGKATENGVKDVAQKVVAQHFHGSENLGKKASTGTRNTRNENLILCYVVCNTPKPP